MKHRLFGIFGQVFFYTLLILVLVISVMAVFFADQIKSVVESTQREQISKVFQSFVDDVKGKSNDEVVRIAEHFHAKNASFEFAVLSSNMQILYRTDHFRMPLKVVQLPKLPNTIVKGGTIQIDDSQSVKSVFNEKYSFVTLVSGDVRLLVSGTVSGESISSAFIEKTFVALLIVLLASVAAAFLFAHRIAKPIRTIAGDARRMSQLEPVPPPPAARQDEIGQLAKDVYKMYLALKSTIRQLETEIEREKQMEENQRYFFSAASHELKTPIAATSALLEGMLENVIEPPEYPAALRECLKRMKEQNKLVSEILEIVALNNHTLVLRQEKVNLRQFIFSGMPAFLPIAESKNQTIDIALPDNVYCTVDAQLFSKAFSNVMLNAIQNTPEGGHIRIYAQETDTGLRLCVLNRNVRIPPELLPKLFEPFYREDKARNREQGRSGLGLTIVKKALEFMEIPYALENTEQGVLFWMEFPPFQVR